MPKWSLIIGLVTVFGLSSATLADDPPPGSQLSLYDRVFLNTTNVYDPTYGLSRIGVIKNHVLEWLPLQQNIRNYPAPKLQTRNFVVYSSHSDTGGSASVSISIPVIGVAGSASSDKVVYANMEDIDEVFAPEKNLSECQIWALMPHDQVSPGDKVILTDHAVFSKVEYGEADKQNASATASIGSFFGVGGNVYKQASNDKKVPLISVSGVTFTVKDPKTFCRVKARSAQLVRFKTIKDLSEELLSVKPEAKHAR